MVSCFGFGVCFFKVELHPFLFHFGVSGLGFGVAGVAASDPTFGIQGTVGVSFLPSRGINERRQRRTENRNKNFI